MRHSDDEDDIAERTWKRASEPVFKEGFREGHEAGKQEALQNGFDAGYNAGYRAGYHLGLKQGALNAMKYIDSLRSTVDQHQQVVDGHKGNCQLCPTVSTGSVKLDMAAASEGITSERTFNDFRVRQDQANEPIFQDPLLRWVKSLN